MNDFDTRALRQALKAPIDPGGAVDVTRIMARGRRLRQRRRLATVAGCLCAAAALAGTATAIANQAAAPSAPLQPAGPGRHAPSGWQRPAPSGVPLPARRQAPRRASATPVPGSQSPTPVATKRDQPGPSALPTPSAGLPSAATRFTPAPQFTAVTRSAPAARPVSVASRPHG